jgi:ABC-type dipeptide/oligopeptide/nickel transport system permease component/ABC-type dipeptide/oligopeptide/nickel transport system permease subunit
MRGVTRGALEGLGLLFAGTIVVFAMLHATRAGRTALGAGKPLLAQYFEWLFRMLRGDLGWSSGSQQPVAQAIGERLGATIELWLISLVAVIALGAIFGFARARLRATPLGNVLHSLELLARALPVFLFAPLVQLAAMFHGLPVAGDASRETFDLGDRMGHLVVPVLLLAVSFGAWSARLFHDFFRTAQSASGSRRGVTAPIAMTISLIGPALLSATIIVEMVFAWPGIGRLFGSSFSLSDLALAGGVVMTFLATIVVMKLVAALLIGTNAWRSAPHVDVERAHAVRFVRPLDANWVSALGLLLCMVLGIIVIGANVFAPMSPNFIDQVHWEGYPLAPGVGGHVLGTDENGRDLLSRALIAVRTSFAIAIFASAVAAAIGVAVARALKRLPRTEDRAALAVTGIRPFGAYPLVLTGSAIVILTAGAKALSIPAIALIIGAVSWPAIVAAARDRGSARSVFATAISVMAGALLIEVTMSFWGFGVQPLAPSLGNMLVNAQSNLTLAPWAVIIPGAVIVASLFALNAVADALRERFEAAES